MGRQRVNESGRPRPQLRRRSWAVLGFVRCWSAIPVPRRCRRVNRWRPKEGPVRRRHRSASEGNPLAGLTALGERDPDKAAFSWNGSEPAEKDGYFRPQRAATIDDPAASKAASGLGRAARRSSQPLHRGQRFDTGQSALCAKILDNSRRLRSNRPHSAHISKETKAWLAEQAAGRFGLTFTPKHGSWLNLVEGFFSKLDRSVLRHIRFASKHELKERIMAAMDDINQHPVVHTWSYKLDKAA
jgi:hypothetical protein